MSFEAAPSARIGPLTRSDVVRYAGAGGDYNPVHHDDEVARSLGLSSVFAMGLFQGGLVAQHLADWVGLQSVTAMSLRFTGRVWPGDILVIDGERAGTECRLQATRNHGEVVVAAKAKVHHA